MGLLRALPWDVSTDAVLDWLKNAPAFGAATVTAVETELHQSGVRAALVMLADSVLAGWVQERLDARIKHLMIDEFQDTNPLQWQALSSWLSGYGGAVGAPSVFLVGDPKQSIYRFRRAEPQVFRAAQAFVVRALGGDLLSCDHTRRNSLAVVGVVNAAMGQAREADGYEAPPAGATA